MNLSKSKYCRAFQCKKMLWLDNNYPELKEEISDGQVLENGTNVGEIAKDLFGFHFDVSFSEDLSIMIKDTKALLSHDSIVITEASFLYDDNFCSVDILRKNKSDFEIYEVKSSTSIKDIYIEDLTYQAYILKSLGYNVTKCSLVYLNNKYERKGKLELKKLFNIEDLTDVVFEKIKTVPKEIEEIKNYCTNKNEPYEDIDLKCSTPYMCPYFNYCNGNLKEGSVFQIRGLSFKKKIEFYKKGIYKYDDLLKSNLNDNYKIQIDYEINDKEDHIDKKKIKEFLATLSYPLYFLDFETYQSAIPEYDNTVSYEQIPFQYSLHYIEDGTLKHKEFLSPDSIDPRRLLAENLVKDIKKDSCVLAYNMSFEKSVIKKLASLYPELEDRLMNIYYNIKDLMIPFKERWYYNKNMHGSYSIKYVLPALFEGDDALNYKNLEQVHNGKEASNCYISLKDLNGEEKEKTRNNLLEYCKLDTLAMVKIWQYLNEIINKKVNSKSK